MTTWEIIKAELIENTKKNTLGRNIAVNKASNIFIKLKDRITDYDESVKCFNSDDEVRDSILAWSGIQKLKDCGVL